jgi:hypothetical protein
MAEFHLQVTVNLAALQGFAQRQLQRLIDQLEFAHAGSALVRDEHYPGQHAFLAFYPSNNTRLSLDAAREASEQWLVLHTLRDSLEVMSQFLEQADRCCAVYQLAAKPEPKGADLMRLDSRSRAFHRLGFPKKVQRLADDFDVTAEFTEHVVSQNDARNCVVHRRGTVSTEDTLQNGRLQVKWIRMRLQAVSSDGATTTDLDGPTVLTAGSSINLITAPMVRSFAVGESVKFSYDDLVGIVITQWRFVGTMAESIQRYAEGLGHKFTKPDPAA